MKYKHSMSLVAKKLYKTAGAQIWVAFFFLVYLRIMIRNRNPKSPSMADIIPAASFESSEYTKLLLELLLSDIRFYTSYFILE